MALAKSKTWISERTIGQMLGTLRSPACEWEPGEGRPAKLTDHFHGVATTTATVGRSTYRVCGTCALLLGAERVACRHGHLDYCGRCEAAREAKRA